MSDHVIEPERLAGLRSRAASRLMGAAATKGDSAGAADALSVLYALASSPDTASDALKLLHELQVHQVELELQAQELHDARAELETALRRQIQLYDFQPVGSFTIDLRLVVHEMNQTGADMLGIGRDEGHGLGLVAFLGADDVHLLLSALSRAGSGMRRSSCTIRLRLRDGLERPVLASIGMDPSAKLCLLSLTDLDEDRWYEPT